MEAGKVFFLGRDIHFPRGYRPRTDSSCWFTPGVLCWGGEEHMMIFGGPSCCGCFSLLLRLLMVTKDSRTLSQICQTCFPSSSLFVAGVDLFVAGLDLFSTISMFLGATFITVFVAALVYCIRYKVNGKSQVVLVWS